MGQLLVVQGTEIEAVQSLFQTALRCFESLHSLQPSAQSFCCTTATAKFPRLKAATAGILRDPGVQAWLCAAGTYFYQDSSGEDALRGLAPRMHASRTELASALADFNGIFALAGHDCSTGELRVITDRLGSLHIYTAVIDSTLVVCTSSLVLAALLRPAWDPVSCREFLATGTVFEQRTLFQGIEKLAPATVFEFRRGHLRSRSSYWDPAAVMYDRSPFRGDVPELAAALEDVFRILARCFRKPVMDLTGGFDSRALLGAMLRSGGDFDTVVNGSDRDPDVVRSQQIARAVGVRHRHQLPSLRSGEDWWEKARASLALCDGEYDVLAYARICDVQNRLAADFDASINGSNGEICKGYWWELLFPFTGWRGHFDERRVAARRFAFMGEAPGLLAQHFTDDLASHFAGLIRRANVGLEQHPNTAKLDNVYLRLRMQRWQGRIASATSRIWPCVSPFMFSRPMEIALSAAPHVRVRNRMARRLLEHLHPGLAAIPLAEGYPAMPLRINTASLFGRQAWDTVRRLQHRVRPPFPGGIPEAPSVSPPHPAQGLWQLAEIRDLLDPASMISGDLYDPAALRCLLEPSRAGALSSPSQFGRILTLELLARAIRR
jgi:asparagine synthase (glutamine-hydrolysing)